MIGTEKDARNIERALRLLFGKDMILGTTTKEYPLPFLQFWIKEGNARLLIPAEQVIKEYFKGDFQIGISQSFNWQTGSGSKKLIYIRISITLMRR